MWCYFMIHQKISFNLPLHLQIRCELEFPAVIVIQHTKDLDHPVFDEPEIMQFHVTASFRGISSNTLRALSALLFFPRNGVNLRYIDTNQM